jgi:hypothetical protein
MRRIRSISLIGLLISLAIAGPAFGERQAASPRQATMVGAIRRASSTPSHAAARRRWVVQSNQASSFLGSSVGTAGDVNGDGYDDVILGAPYYHHPSTEEGEALVYLGSATGPSTTAAWTAESNQASGHFGWSVGSAGDVNGDGYDDVIVGAYTFDNGQTDEGRAYVYHGSPTGLSLTPNWTAESNQAFSYFGSSVGTAGDVNADGYDDVIVGAEGFTHGQGAEGRAFVYLGSASGLSTTPGWVAESDQVAANFGTSVGTAGDVNGDGYDDVIVGADLYDNGQSSEGRAYVYQGSATGLGTTPAWTAESDHEAALFGNSVGTAGDVNGDGYDDAILGALQYDDGQVLEGAAFVYHGSAAGLSTLPNWTVESDEGGAKLGTSVGTAGDVNGDGYDEAIVGAPYFGPSDVGLAALYDGSSAGLSTSPDWTAQSNQGGSAFGASVGTAGDVNGDGYDDVIVGAPSYDKGETDEGVAFAYLGGP